MGRVFLFLSILFLCNAYGGDDPFNPTGNPVGGGHGYSFIISIDDNSIIAIAGTREELISALAAAVPGDVVYIHPDSAIDLTGSYSPLVIPGGVTLASNRGENYSSGGKIFKKRLPSDTSVQPDFALAAGGEGVRLTGIRLEGPDKTAPSNDHTKAGFGSEYSHTEVDNCEIYGWSYYGVSCGSGGQYSHIHHCYIHHCRSTAYGFGIINSGTLLVEANRFSTNRHDVAGQGEPSNFYEARFNLNQTGHTGHIYVVRGEGLPECGSVYIHHNVFTNPNMTAARLNSVPSRTAWFEWNWYAFSDCIEQKNGNGNIVNVKGTSKNYVLTALKNHFLV